MTEPAVLGAIASAATFLFSIVTDNNKEKEAEKAHARKQLDMYTKLIARTKSRIRPGSNVHQQLNQLNEDVQKLHITIGNKGRAWFRRWSKPAVHFQAIRDDIAAINMKYMDILQYTRRPPSMFDVVEMTNLVMKNVLAELGPFVDEYLRFLEDSFRGSEATSVRENSGSTSVRGNSGTTLAVENVAPQPRQPANPQITGYGMVDPSTHVNFRPVFVELQQALERQRNKSGPKNSLCDPPTEK
ncbi:hypothetical protein BGX27_004655 [Mortierella sp. AM989]|nr:hypothetical protein BGX27_004655 [Mortierella sp. AM989]